MTGEHENDRCYFCGGRLEYGLTTIPFVLEASVVIVKRVPAYICVQCDEAIMDNGVAKTIEVLLKQAKQSGFEVSVVTYQDKIRETA